MKVKYKKSRQRDRLLELLQSTDIHPTAFWLYDRLKKDFPSLSLGTVYRNLDILEKQGLIKKLDFLGTNAHYDANLKDHFHFICEKCGKIIDLDIQIKDILFDRLTDLTNLKPDRLRVEFFGLCRDCSSGIKD